MNLYLKNISLLLCIILIIGMSDCSKDNPKNQNQISKHDFHDFRDSIVGNYNCIEHYATHQFTYDSTGTHDIYTDTKLSAITVVVSKLASNDSSILVDGSTIFNSAYPTTSNNQTLNFFSTDPTWGVPDGFYFTTSNDSIWFQQYTEVQQYHQAYYYWTGRKQ